MGLPKITFNVATDGLGQLQADIQKVPGLVITGATVAGGTKVTVGQSYQIFSLAEAVALGIEETGTNAFAYKEIADFYAQAKIGAELWFMLVIAATTMEDMANITLNFGRKLIEDAGGRIRVLGIVKKSPGGEVIANGLDNDVDKCVIKAQALAEDFESRYYHFRVIISGNSFNGTVADLKDYENSNYSKCSILLANNDGAKSASIGMALGRLASIPVQRKLHRVKDGAVEPTQAFFTNGATVESLTTSWETIDDKSYIFLRSFTGKSGYYFTNDVTLTASTDDFKSLSNGFVMDKTILICYNTLLDELSDEIPVTASGIIQPAIIKTWQNKIETQVKAAMVDNGELSDFKAYINENQNILSTGELELGLSLLPVGYAQFITVNIGFTTSIE